MLFCFIFNFSSFLTKSRYKEIRTLYNIIYIYILYMVLKWFISKSNFMESFITIYYKV